MARLSAPITRMKASYDVVVVGSGYGGAVAASRLARARLRVCVLERGREFQPGDYPDTLGRILGEAQLDTPHGRFFSPAGLFDLRFNEDMSVVAGCGLGGTSLINAGVALAPIDEVLRDRRWPEEIRKDFESGRLAAAFGRAVKMLGARPYEPPRGSAELKKFSALAAVARHFDADVKRPPICVNLQGRHDGAGAARAACHRCGDCVSGCNWGAKNTLIMNYLPDARANDAEIYTEVTVRRLERRRDGEWDVHYEMTGAGRWAFGAVPMTVRARIVVLAAGTLGSTEILLRSRANGSADHGGLRLSNELGKHFTGNADTVAIAHNTDTIVNAIGTGRRELDRKEPVGPCITGLVDLRKREGLGLVIEEGVVPGALAGALQAVLSGAAVLGGRFEGARKDASVADVIARWARVLQGPHAGAMRRSFIFLAMGADDASGELYLDDDRVRVRWPGAGRQPIVETLNDCLGRATVPLRGTFVANPLPVTVHPLGGCRMADDAAHGVVNHAGQVFQGTTGTATYDSLYVCDGAMIPLPLGVNPLLTITGLAERMCDGLIRREQLRSDDRPVAARASQVTGDRLLFTEAERPGLQFTERMSGHLVLAGPLGSPRSRLRDGPSIECALTVTANDCEQTAMDWHHPATAVGTITASVLSTRPMTVRRGQVSLLTPDPERVGVRYLVYELRATSDTGREYVFTGRKRVRRASPLHAWGELTTLYMHIDEHIAAGREIRVARARLRLTFRDFLRQLRTMRTTNTYCFTQRVDASARFFGFFAGMLVRTYGGWLARAELSTGDAPPGHPRRLRAQKSYRVSTSDRTSVHLTNYPRRSATRGPVLLAPGFSVSASSFATDTVDKNLVDFLGDAGYDVWLLEYRASSDFPEAASEFTVDDVAIRDYPAAINAVLAITGAARLQIVAHCVGSMALLMALIARRDLRKLVRSVVCSQLGLHPHAPPQTEAKCKLRLGSILRGLGVKAMTARFEPFDLDDRVLDRILNLLPTRERCASPTCRRILFLFGESYRHARLSTETHDAIGNWFGVTSMTAMKHIALMVREKRALDHYGDDVYLPRVRNLRLPISFMHGSLNREFLPHSTYDTYRLLGDTNGRGFYRWKTFRGFGHMDCFIGRNAHRVVFPWILTQLDHPPAGVRHRVRSRPVLR